MKLNTNQNRLRRRPLLAPRSAPIPSASPSALPAVAPTALSAAPPLCSLLGELLHRCAWRDLARLYPEDLHTVLEVGCRTGEWIMNQARRPLKTVVGIDSHPDYLTFARRQAQSRELHQVQWLLTSLLSLPLPDEGYTLVYGAHLALRLPSQQWPLLLAEMTRVCGGSLLLTELAAIRSNSRAWEHLLRLLTRLCQQTGRDLMLGEHRQCSIEGLLLQAGCSTVLRCHTPIKLGSGWERTEVRQLGQELLYWIHPLLVAAGLVTPQDFQDLTHRLLHDLERQDFHLQGSLVTFVGLKQAPFLPGERR